MTFLSVLGYTVLGCGVALFAAALVITVVKEIKK